FRRRHGRNSDGKLSHLCPRLSIAVLLSMFATCGCGDDGPEMGAVTGNVEYADGSLPAGGVNVIRFVPVGRSEGGYSKAASNDIQPDGSYVLQTIKPGDGAIHGTYKVVFTILESYRSGKSLVAAKFTDPKTTPFEVVIDSASHEFDFTIENIK
ncbi:hypothetical protein OAS39_10065, partial [Pirellulales bacterium]|nr:hypothetical protein [Pirellulales bacterium]